MKSWILAASDKKRVQNRSPQILFFIIINA